MWSFESVLRPLRAITRRRCLAIMAAASLQCTVALGEDLGVIGPVYPIAERDLLAMIESRLRAKEANGSLAAIRREATERAVRSVENPEPVPGLNTATKAKTYYYDPSVVAPYPVVDDTGRILIAAGTRLNPLDTVSLSKRLLFFDARDAQQVRLARAVIETHGGQIKPILTGGAYMNLMRRWKLRVYYDQQGVLTRQLGIGAVPALVSQEGKRLRIDELPRS
jgi:conjugal transfer pilus assembly protein TraW